MTDRVIQLYKELYDHTEPECRQSCRVPQSCCSPEYCEMAEEWARVRWGVDVNFQRTGHKTLPFMSDVGCVLSPHHRPLCTKHTCQVNSIGFKPGDEAWTKRYFELTDELSTMGE